MFLGGLLITLVLLLVVTLVFWRNRLDSKTARKPKCGFKPARVTLSGTHGEVLTACVAAEGPDGAVFATFVEEPWVVVSPSSGMFPQDLEIAVHTKHAPEAGRRHVTVRLLPVDGESQFGSLDLVLKLRKTRGSPIGTRL